MGKGKIVLLVLVGVALSFNSASAQKMKVATALRLYAPYALPLWAAEDKGLWKQNGLDAEWFPFKNGPAMSRAIAGGVINIGVQSASLLVRNAAAGLPVRAVSQVDARERYAMWVPAASARKKPADIKGAKIGVSRLGGLAQIYSRIMLKRLGLEKEVRFVGTGGMMASIAMLKTGKIDARLASYWAFMKLWANDEVRDLMVLEDYLPKPWISTLISVRRPFLASNPDKVKRAVKAMIQAVNFVHENRAWSVEKLKAGFGYNDKAAGLTHRMLDYTRDGKLNVEGLKNVRSFMIEYGIIKEEKAPPLRELYTTDITG